MPKVFPCCVFRVRAIQFPQHIHGGGAFTLRHSASVLLHCLSIVVGDRDGYVGSGYRSVVGSANAVGYGGRVVGRITIFLGPYSDGLRIVPILCRECKGCRICSHFGVGWVIDGHHHGACGLSVQLDRVGASAAFTNSEGGFRDGNAPGVVVGDRDGYIGSSNRSVVGSPNSMGYSGRVVPRIIIFLGRYSDGLGVTPSVRRESQGGRIRCHVGVGWVVYGYRHVACRFAVQYDCVGVFPAFSNNQGRGGDGHSRVIVVVNVDDDVLIGDRVYRVRNDALIVHRIIIFCARYSYGPRNIPIVWRESQGRRICRHVRVGWVADCHNHIACRLGFQRNRVGDVAAFIYIQVGIRDIQEVRKGVAAVAIAAAAVITLTTVVVVVVVVVLAALVPIAPRIARWADGFCYLDTGAIDPFFARRTASFIANLATAIPPSLSHWTGLAGPLTAAALHLIPPWAGLFWISCSDTAMVRYVCLSRLASGIRYFNAPI